MTRLDLSKIVQQNETDNGSVAFFSMLVFCLAGFVIENFPVVILRLQKFTATDRKQY